MLFTCGVSSEYVKFLDIEQMIRGLGRMKKLLASQSVLQGIVLIWECESDPSVNVGEFW